MPRKTYFCKLSGEQLSGSSGKPLDSKSLHRVADQLASLHVVAQDNDTGLVFKPGGGNIYRGREGVAKAGDAIGRLATAFNVLAISGVLTEMSVPHIMVLPSTMTLKDEQSELPHVFRPYSVELVDKALSNDQLVLSAAGLGQNGVTGDFSITEMAGQYAALNRVEGRQGYHVMVLKGTQVNAVRLGDPALDPEAPSYKVVSAHTLEADPGRHRVVDAATPEALIRHQLSMLVFHGEIPLVEVISMFDPTAPAEEHITGGTLVVPYECEPIFYE